MASMNTWYLFGIILLSSQRPHKLTQIIMVRLVTFLFSCILFSPTDAAPSVPLKKARKKKKAAKPTCAPVAERCHGKSMTCRGIKKSFLFWFSVSQSSPSWLEPPSQPGTANANAMLECSKFDTEPRFPTAGLRVQFLVVK